MTLILFIFTVIMLWVSLKTALNYLREGNIKTALIWLLVGIGLILLFRGFAYYSAEKETNITIQK